MKFRLVSKDIFRYIYMHGPGASCPRQMKSLFNHGSQLVNIQHEVVMFGNRQRYACNICLLKRIFPQKRPRDLTGNSDHRHGVHIRIGNPRYKVGGAGA